MTYNLYIKTSDRIFNIFILEKSDLDIVINAYNIGKYDFFIAGKKYWISNLFEIKIFQFKHSEKIQDFIDLAKQNRLFVKGGFGSPYLPPDALRQGGIDVTRDFIKGDYGHQAKNKNIDESLIEMDIFISHNSNDIEIAKLIIEIVRKAFNIHSDRIRCTSVPGYKLKAGANTDEQLKKEIFSAKAFIGLITRESINSTYVLFELGARWGVNLPLIPLICDQAGVSLLSGPIKNINALSAIDSSDMLQFLNDLGDILELKAENPAGYIDDIEKLKKFIMGDNMVVIKDAGLIEDEYKDALDLIKKQSEIEWPDNYEMKLDYIESQTKAVEKLKQGKPDDLTIEEFNRIRERATREWPLNYEMRVNEEETQIKALRKLKEI